MESEPISELEPRNERVEEEIDDYLKKGKDDLTEADFEEKPAEKRGKLLVIGSLVLLLLLAFAFYSYSKGHASFAKEKVNIAIEVPQQVGSGDETSFSVVCKNDNPVALTNARLEIFLPDNFVLGSSDQTLSKDGSVYRWNVQDIGAKSAQTVRIYGKIIGMLGETKDMRALLSFRPSNFNSVFQVTTDARVGISSIPVELALNLPETIKDSAESELTFDYRNISKRDYDKVRLEIEFPKSFVVSSTEPAMAETGGNNSDIYALEEEGFREGTGKSVKVRGTFQSQQNTETVKARVFLQEKEGIMSQYAQAQKDIRLEKTEIALTQTVNGQADYGVNKNEELTYRISFKNQSGQDLRGLVLRSTLSGKYDLATLKASQGSVSGDSIVWSAMNVPELAQLAPGSEGSVEFKVRVLDKIDISKDTDKNFSVKNLAQISSFNAAAGSAPLEKLIAKHELESKLKAFLSLDTTGYFNDDGRIVGGGALPPKVGQQTLYTVHWILRNYFNDAQNVRVTTTLPAGVAWTGRYIDANDQVHDESANVGRKGQPASGSGANIAAERVYYDANLNQVIWEMPGLKANDGILTPAREIVFQLGAQPSAKDVGKTMTLIQQSTAAATDLFTNTVTASTGTKLTTDLTSTDYSISQQEAVVRQ